jgi:hypothetical protein
MDKWKPKENLFHPDGSTSRRVKSREEEKEPIEWDPEMTIEEAIHLGKGLRDAELGYMDDKILVEKADLECMISIILHRDYYSNRYELGEKFEDKYLAEDKDVD